MSFLRATAPAAALIGVTLLPTFAADPNGTWQTEEGRGTVRMSDCGGALCGTLIALKEPIDPQTGKPKLDRNNTDPGERGRPIVGIQIVSALKAAGPNKW